MDNKLEELLNNYNYLLEAVKNNQITPDDAVKTLDSLSVIDNSGRIWKMNLYGEFVSGFPGGELEKSEPLAFNNTLDNIINYNIPPSEGIYDEVVNKQNSKPKRKREKKDIDISKIKKARTPMIIIISLFIAFYFYNTSNNNTVESDSINYETESKEGEEISLANENKLSQSTENKGTLIEPQIDENSENITNDSNSNEKIVGNKTNFKIIEGIFTNISKNKNLAVFKNENESVEQIYLKRAQIEGYLAVGLKIKVDKIVKNNENYYYYINIFLNDKVLIIGKGQIYDYNESLSDIKMSWPIFKRANK